MLHSFILQDVLFSFPPLFSLKRKKRWFFCLDYLRHVAEHYITHVKENVRLSETLLIEINSPFYFQININSFDQ